MRSYNEILLSPIFTERTAKKIGNFNQYCFKVKLDANKIEIARAVEKAFDLKNKVLSVNTQINHGKRKSLGRSSGQRSDWKKALVTLVKGAKIEDIFPEEISGTEEE
jgi:large subunit ribosomal protein L23